MGAVTATAQRARGQQAEKGWDGRGVRESSRVEIKARAGGRLDWGGNGNVSPGAVTVDHGVGVKPRSTRVRTKLGRRLPQTDEGVRTGPGGVAMV